MEDKACLNYEAELKNLKAMMQCKEHEFKEKEQEYINNLIKYEREIEVLKAKLSMVELIFGK